MVSSGTATHEGAAGAQHRDRRNEGRSRRCCRRCWCWGGEETKKQNTEKCARATHRPTGSGSLLEAPWSRDGGLTITIVPRAQASRSRRRASVSHGTAAAEAHTEAALALSLFPSWSSPLLSRPLLLLLRRCWCSLCARCLLACSLALTLPGLLLLLLVRCCSAVFDVAVVDAAKHLLCCSVFWLCSRVCVGATLATCSRSS